MPCTSTAMVVDEAFHIGPVAVASIVALRLAILRPDERDESWCRYAGDHGAESVHLKAVHRETGEGAGMVTVVAESRTWGDREAGFRVRGLGVSPAHRHGGLGRSLLERAVRAVEGDGRGVWLSGRTARADFYLGSGFEVVSEPYMVTGTGEHADFCLLETP